MFPPEIYAHIIISPERAEERYYLFKVFYVAIPEFFRWLGCPEGARLAPDK